MSILENPAPPRDSSRQPPILELKGIAKTFNNDLFKKKRSALEDLSLRFERGKCTGLLGHNGAGKTTAIRIILGILFPDRGEIIFEDRPLTTAAKIKIGYMPEINKLAGAFTPYEILASHLRLFCPDLSADETKGKIEAKLRQVRLWDHRHKKIKALSKGMSRRVAWSQASIHSPSLLILDEPFSGLDPLGRKDMQTWIEAEKQRGASIVLCTHELWTVDALCDNIYVLRGGKLVHSSGSGVENDRGSGDHHRYVMHTSGTTEDVLKSLKNKNKLPTWQKIEQEGWSTKVFFRDYADAARWMTACVDAGYLIISFRSDISPSESMLLSYFDEKGATP